MPKVIPPLRPETTARIIENWRLLQTYRALHLFGIFPPHLHFWVTPAIVTLDALTLRAVAQDGVVYRLAGEPGDGMFAAQFVGWCAAFDERLEGTKDVTDSLLGEASIHHQMMGDTAWAGHLPISWPEM